MTRLGLRDGIALCFSQGTLSAIEAGRFGRTFMVKEEFSALPEPAGPPLPYLPLEAGLDMSDARYRGLDPYSGRQMHQNLAGGTRTVTILQGQMLPSSGVPEPLLARAVISMSLNAPLAYRLRVAEDSVWESDETGAEAYLGDGGLVRVSATSALAIEDNGHRLRIDLPAGPSTIEVWIEIQPPLSLAPAVVICLPWQTREAAIVASAIGGGPGTYVPILDLSLPPMSAADTQAAQARLAEISAQVAQLEQQMRSTAQQGAQAAGGLVLPGAQSVEQRLEQLVQQREALLAEMEPLEQRIVTYAAWLRHSAVLSRIITALTTGSRQSRRLFVLATYPVDVLAQWAATADMTVLVPRSSEEETQVWRQTVATALPDADIEVVLWQDGQDLATQVWKRVRGGETPAFFAIPDEPAFYVPGLLDALRRGRALLPRGRAGGSVNLDNILDNLNSTVASDHVVVIEADGSVASLVGALYAYHIGARLAVTPPPQVGQTLNHLRLIGENIQREQLAMLASQAYRYIGEHRKTFMQSQTADPQLKQLAAGLSILELPATVPTPYSEQAFVQYLTTYLTAQQAGVQQGYRYDDSQWQQDLATLEAQVAGALSPHAQQVVGQASRVTVITAGLPYGLAPVCQGKTVGLVLRDLAAPYLLRTVTQSSVAKPSLTLGLVFDPGLNERPVPDVESVVDRMITLRTTSASLTNLALLASTLPLDVLVLHTQGNADSLIVSETATRLREVHASDVGAQVRLSSASLVVYGAALAWLGTGVALLEQGAGGFVGTLWPVDGITLEDVARVVLPAVMTKGQNPAEALLALPSFSERSRRAFVYLGTAAPWATSAGDVVAAAPVLYDVAARLAVAGRHDLATMLYDRMRALTGEAAVQDSILRAELLLLDADLHMRLAGHRAERPAQDVMSRLEQHIDNLASMGLPDAYAHEIAVGLRERMAMLAFAAEDYARAEELLTTVRESRRTQGQAAAELAAAYLLAVVQERQQRWAAARQTLLEVQRGIGTLGNAVALVSVATSLAYVSLPLAMYPDVTNHLKLAMQTGLALGVQVLSETLVQALDVAKAMAKAGALADLAIMLRTLADTVRADGHLPEADRTSVVAVLNLMQETVEVLRSPLSAEEREGKLAALVEQAQANELARTLGLDAWILGSGSRQTDEAQSADTHA